MFDVERNMGLKLKKLMDKDIYNGEQEYNFGLMNEKDVAKELGEPCDVEEEFLHDGVVFKENSKRVYNNIKAKFEDKIQRIKFEEQERLNDLQAEKAVQERRKKGDSIQ